MHGFMTRHDVLVRRKEGQEQEEASETRAFPYRRFVA